MRKSAHFLSLISLIAVSCFQMSFADEGRSLGEEVKISSINGEYNPNQSRRIQVNPGDVISLSADVFEKVELSNGERVYDAQLKYLEDFIWLSSTQRNTACDPMDAQRCLNETLFEVTDAGVNFYVPENQYEDIELEVYYRNDPRSVDRLVLVMDRNTYPGNYHPGDVVSDPEDYQDTNFVPERALTGQGRWVYIHGERYFVPYRYTSDWVPYSNGYWSYVNGVGLTWISYDPWGWYTDHYGYWRHHGNYGWVWAPFPDRVYRPHTVTWFHHQDYVGWYPYYDAYRNGYRHGEAHGFNDGYWEGFNAGRNYERNHYYYNPSRGLAYYPGFSVVRRGSFTNIDIRLNRLGLDISVTTFRSAFGGRSVGTSVTWFNDRLRTSITVSRIRDYRNYNGFVLRGAERNHDVPNYYRGIRNGLSDSYRNDRDSNRVGNRRIGSVINEGRNWVAPTRGARGISDLPRLRDRNSGQERVVNVPRRENARINPDNRPLPRNRGDAVNPAPAQPQPTKPTQPGRRPGRGGGVNPPKDRPSEPVRNPERIRVPAPRDRDPVTPRPDPRPAPRPTPAPSPRPDPKPAPAPRPDPRPAPRPTPAPSPRPDPKPAPAPRPDPRPAPRPTPAPSPRPDPRPAPAPRPDPRPAPRPTPAPSPRPDPRPAPAPRPDPRPAPRPTPAPSPRPTPSPRPAPAPRPAPPKVSPSPRPTPAPAPRPTPSPRAPRA